MKKLIFITFLFANLYADMLGVNATLGYKNTQLTGSLKYRGDDIKTDLDTDSGIYISASFEHPIPLIPNLRANLYTNSFSDRDFLSTAKKFDNKTFSGVVSKDFDFTNLDTILYYEILDNYVNLDVGVNLKLIDSSFRIQNSTKDFVSLIPMLYGSAKIDLPLTNLSFGVDLNAFAYDENVAYDAKASFFYETSLGFGFEAGYKEERYDTDFTAIDLDIKMKSIIFALFYHF